MVRLSDRETFKLLELYKQNECLWHPIYNNKCKFNRQQQQLTYEAIARELNIENFPALAVRNKLKSLRWTYRLELKKIKRMRKQGIRNFNSALKWFSPMDAIFKLAESCESPEDNLSLENGEHAPKDIFADDSHCDLQTGSCVEIASESFSSAPSLPSESEIEQSVKSIAVHDAVTLTPEIQNVRSLSSSDLYSVIPEIQKVPSVSHAQVVTLTPDNPADKSISSSETITATSGIQQTAKSVSNSSVTTTPSGIQTAKTTLTPTIFALVPDIQTSTSVSNPRFITVSAGNNQNVRYVSGSPAIKLAPGTQKKFKQVSTDETPLNRKRRHEVNSTDSNTEVHQINNTKSTIGDSSDRSEDEMDAFGHFVAMNLKKLSMQSALSAQSEILSILTRHRLSDSATNMPSKQTFPCIVTNSKAAAQNPLVLEKLLFKS